MNPTVKRELLGLPDNLIKQIKEEYNNGVGLTNFDLANKYNISFSACCYITKSNNLKQLLL
jgi:hypothetical protein